MQITKEELLAFYYGRTVVYGQDGVALPAGALYFDDIHQGDLLDKHPDLWPDVVDLSTTEHNTIWLLPMPHYANGVLFTCEIAGYKFQLGTASGVAFNQILNGWRQKPYEL